MIRRKRPRSLTDYRRVLDSQGEIVIGAYAEQQRRRRIAIGLFGGALILLAVWFYFGLRPHDTHAGRYPVAVQCVNEQCGYRAVVYIRPGQEAFPMACPQCGNRSCYKLWQCRNPACGAVFLHRGEPSELRCPKCGSRTVGTAETLPAERPEGDVE
jgi:predicted RNA-binding Zn-ribbon protein involved in translation (DUF1610 family)